MNAINISNNDDDCYKYKQVIEGNLAIVWVVLKKSHTLKKAYFTHDDFPLNHTFKTSEINQVTIPSELYDKNVDDEPIKILAIGGKAINSFKYIPLNRIIVSAGIKKLHPCAFAYLENVDEIILPRDIIQIPDKCFCYSGIKKIILKQEIKSIGKYAFYNAHQIKNIVIPDGCHTISEFAFAASSISHIKLGKGVKNVCEGAFCKCQNLKQIIWPENCVNIPIRCFCESRNLRKVEFKGNIESVNSLSFHDTNIYELNFLYNTIPPFIHPLYANSKVKKQVKIINPFYCE